MFSVVISPFSFLIVLIWFFSLCFLMSLTYSLPVLFIFSKNQLLTLLIFAMVSFVFISALIFKISFLLLTLGFSISSFSSRFRCRVNYLFDLFLVSWGVPVLLWTFPLALLLQCPTGFGLLCFHFHLFLCIFWFLISSVICWLFRSVLFSLHMLGFLIVFLLRSNLSALWSEKMLGMISMFFEFIKVRFMAQDVIYPGKGSVSTWEKGEIHCFWVKCPIDIN